MPPLKVDVATAGFGTVVAIAGELDIATTPQVREAFSSPAVVEGGGVLVDLTGVTFMDSTGLGMFLTLDRDLRERGARLAIACPEGAARLLFDVAGVNEILPLYPSREDAEAAMAGSP